jgi:hypothetical protein
LAESSFEARVSPRADRQTEGVFYENF